ncbi:MAG: LysR family transcriptional regulator [Geminicoccaceae bacterium]
MRQLQVLNAVAATRSFGRAAERLGMSQPSISQQLMKLERQLGLNLVDRESRPLRLTKAGQFLLSHAEAIFLALADAESGMREFANGTRGHLTVGASTSLASFLLARASITLKNTYPNVRLDVVEISPGEVVQQLLARKFRMALLASITDTAPHTQFAKVELAQDVFVLAVPKGVDLEDRRDFAHCLETPAALLLRSAIGVDVEAVGTRQSREWYRRFLPGCREVARCSSYELALSMVEVRLGVAIVPLLATQLDGHTIFDVELYRLPILPYGISAILPSQHRYMQPYAAFLDMLVDAGRELSTAKPRPPPPFLLARHDPVDELAV